MTNSTTGSRWMRWVLPILLLVAGAAAVWLVGSASPSIAVESRMAEVKIATPLPAATAAAETAHLRQATATRTPAPTPTLVPTLPAPPTSSALASLNQVPRISVDAARALVEQGAAVFVDVRTAATYKQGHLPGAVLVPGDISSSGYGELADDRLLIFYCA